MSKFSRVLFLALVFVLGLSAAASAKVTLTFWDSPYHSKGKEPIRQTASWNVDHLVFEFPASQFGENPTLDEARKAISENSYLRHKLEGLTRKGKNFVLHMEPGGICFDVDAPRALRIVNFRVTWTGKGFEIVGYKDQFLNSISPSELKAEIIEIFGIKAKRISIKILKAGVARGFPKPEEFVVTAHQ